MSSRLRPNVARLLRGDVRADDLRKLFLYARDHCGSRKAVKEIGHFAAHHARERGEVTTQLRDWAVVSTYAYVHRNRGAMVSTSMPPLFPDLLKSSARSLSEYELNFGFGLDRESVEFLAGVLSRKFLANDDGTWRLDQRTTAVEDAYINYCLSRFPSNPVVMTGSTLFDEFRKTLEENGLLLLDERPEFEKYRRHIVLFAVSLLHNCEIAIDESNSITLLIDSVGAADEILKIVFDNKVHEDSKLVDKLEDGSGIFFETTFHVPITIFNSQISVSDALAPSLRQLGRSSGFDVEIDSEGRLVRVE